MVGKSSLLKEILLEKEQFKMKIEQLVYIYSIEDDNIKRLKKKYAKNGIFLKEIPENIEDILLPGKSVLVIDDKEEDILNDKDKIRVIQNLSKIWVHHNKYIFFLLLQTFDIFYKRHPLNGALQQCSKLILFRSVSNLSSLKRWLNGYCIRLKSNQTLFDIYKSHVLADNFAYLIIDLSHNLKSPHVYSNILYKDQRPMIVFSIESDDTQ